MQQIPLPEGELTYVSSFFSPSESNRLLQELVRDVAWRQDKIRLFGKEHLQPRLTAWYGDPGKSYTYSSLRLDPLPWTPPLLEIKGRVEEAAGVTFNSVLVNYYRHGQDSMGWHSDDEPELGQNPVIASVSFGGARRFSLRHKFRKEVERVSLELTHGSLLLMAGPTQHFWKHQVAKTARQVEPRLNLTYRFIRI
jgi:alkylated DNA repair dioxygenase AlkB